MNYHSSDESEFVEAPNREHEARRIYNKPQR